MFERIVLFKLPNFTPEDDRRMVEMVRRFPAEIPGIVHCVAGRDTGGQAGDWTHALVLRFVDRAACEEYLPHPTHVAFSDWLFSHPGVEVSRIVFDLGDADLEAERSGLEQSLLP